MPPPRETAPLLRLATLAALGLTAALPQAARARNITVTDLNPAEDTSSYATGVSGGSQVGYGDGTATGGDSHALLWTGTAVSAIDLNPAGYSVTGVLAASGGSQVGEGYGAATGGNFHALLWSGAAASVIDLNALLPAGFNTTSCATGVDAFGDVVGYGEGSAGTDAFLWHIAATPEPSSLAGVALGVLGLAGLILRARMCRA